MVKSSSGKLKYLALNGTEKVDKVCRNDLSFWLPHTKGHLREGIPFVSTFDELLKLPTAQIGYILSIIITIIRKNRVVGGDRLSNCSLKVKVDGWQRIIRAHFAKEDSQALLFNRHHTVRQFNVLTDPHLLILKCALNKSMKKSADEGKCKGMLKANRTDIRPEDIRRVLQLYNSDKPSDIEFAFGFTILLQLGVRGGSELRKMN